MDCFKTAATDYYVPVAGLSGNDLKDALSKLIRKHECLGYRSARDFMYGQIDNDGGAVEGVYTGRRFPHQQGIRKEYIDAEDCDDEEEHIQGRRGFLNCEHTWPQSFFNKREPMRSDIFHLYPTDSDANSRRGSYPFGEVERIKWEKGGSMQGTDESGRRVFEPRDSHKGNVARAIFYFATCYGDRVGSKEEAVLRKWHELDPVDDDEKNRNKFVYKLQRNRNPFIDHPEWVSEINDF